MMDPLQLIGNLIFSKVQICRTHHPPNLIIFSCLYLTLLGYLVLSLYFHIHEGKYRFVYLQVEGAMAGSAESSPKVKKSSFLQRLKYSRR